MTNNGAPEVTYDYGGDGLRRSRTAVGATTQYRWSGCAVVNEENGSGTLTRRYVGRTMAQVDGAAWTYFTHDHLDSPRMMTDASKNVTGRLEHTPYGDIYGESLFAPGPRTQLVAQGVNTGVGVTSDIMINHMPFGDFVSWGMTLIKSFSGSLMQVARGDC